MHTESAVSPSQEKPLNGVAGLKYWKSDLVAGLLVSLTSLPLSLGIAIASGAPPITGLTSAIIAGLLMPFLGGTFVTISGPAAGLAPALLAIMTQLGGGDLARGYPLLLVVICCVGVVQIILSFLKAAKVAAIFPSAVVEGMLAAIGMLIIAKQLPAFIGHRFHAHEFFEYWLELPEELPLMNIKVFIVSMTCLALLLLLSNIKARWTKSVPPQLLVVILGVVLGRVLGLDPQFLIALPDKPLAHGFVTPHFSEIIGNPSLWRAVAIGILTLTMIDAVESLATAMAIDKIDPYQRKSDPNRTLLAMGISNICSSVIGGLTIIPGGVKSKVCITAGGKTLWANFYNAIFLLIFLFVAKNLINLIPLGALAAVLIHTGWKMCEPKIWRHVAHIGKEQLFLFSATIAVTLLTDLLVGILAGVIFKLLLNAALINGTRRGRSHNDGFFQQFAMPTLDGVLSQFRDPVSREMLTDGANRIVLDRPIVCFNVLRLSKHLESIPKSADHVVLHLDKSVPLIDHTTCEVLLQFVDEYRKSTMKTIEIVGLDEMKALSSVDSATRLALVDLETATEDESRRKPTTIRQRGVRQDSRKTLEFLGLLETDED